MLKLANLTSILEITGSDSDILKTRDLYDAIDCPEIEFTRFSRGICQIFPTESVFFKKQTLNGRKIVNSYIRGVRLKATT